MPTVLRSPIEDQVQGKSLVHFHGKDRRTVDTFGGIVVSPHWFVAHDSMSTQYLLPSLYFFTTFPSRMVNSREEWYETCFSHTDIQDKSTLEHLFIDEQQNEVSVLLTGQAIERSIGVILLEIKMNTLYNL